MKYDYKKAYDKNLKPSARLHYLENARHDKDSMAKMVGHGSMAKQYGSMAKMDKSMAMKKDISPIMKHCTPMKMDYSPMKKTQPHGKYADQGLIKSYKKGDKYVAIDKSEHDSYTDERIASSKALKKAKKIARQNKAKRLNG